MMSAEYRLPALPLGDSEVRIVHWLKRLGDALSPGDPLLVVVGEHAEVVLPAPDRGSLEAILASEGAVVAVGAPIARVAAAQPAGPGLETPAEHAPAAARSPQPLAPAPRAASERPCGISPVASRIAAAAQVDLTGLIGSGPGGRIMKSDVLAAIPPATDHRPPTTDHRLPTIDYRLPGRTENPFDAAVPELVEGQGMQEPRTTELEPIAPISNLQSPSPMRRAIAAHMIRSRASSPHAMTAMEVDMGRVADARARLKANFARGGLDLTYTACIALAAVAALMYHPLLNSSWSEAGIIVRRRVHLGIAAALPDGLITPVVRDAQDLNLRGMARAVGDLARRARAGALRPGETSGGTFTITNPGSGALWFGTPIINQPQGAILGVGVVRPCPLVVSEGQIDRIAIRPALLLTLAYDARVLDLHHADAFLHDVKNWLECFS